MPLSEYEQRVLEQMERQLTSDDPKLVNTFQGGSVRSVRRWLLAGAGVVVGLTLLVVGAVVSQPLIGVLGFVAMFVSVIFAFSAPRRGGPSGVVAQDGSVRPAKPRAAKQGFIARFEERWDRRREGGR